METSTQKLSTAVEILAAFNAVATDAGTNAKAEAIDLLKDLAKLFMLKPDAEIARCITNSSGLVHSVLVKMLNLYPVGSNERRAVASKGIALVDQFVKAGDFDATDDWLVTGYWVFSCGSEERKAVVAKRLSLVDKIVKAGNLNAAEDLLVTGYNVYESGSAEEKAVVAKQEQLRQLRSLKQMGAAPKPDIGVLRAVAKRELAKLQTEKVAR